MSLENQTWRFNLQQPGIRYELRQPPLWMIMNMHDGKCWCGKPKELWEKFQRKYCCGEHAQLWFYSIRAYWGSFRMQVYRRDNFVCQECGFKIKENENGFNRCDWEVDHILAICLDGMCFDLENVRLLCRKCHNKKTGQDMRMLAFKRKKLQTLENFLKSNENLHQSTYD